MLEYNVKQDKLEKRVSFTACNYYFPVRIPNTVTEDLKYSANTIRQLYFVVLIMLQPRNKISISTQFTIKYRVFALVLFKYQLKGEHFYTNGNLMGVLVQFGNCQPSHLENSDFPTDHSVPALNYKREKTN